MARRDFKSRIDDGREAAQAGLESLSAGAREAVATARDRIGSTYGAARREAHHLADSGRDLARSGYRTGSRVAKRGRGTLEEVAFSARGLVAERPLTAIAIGIVAGTLVGFLANRLATARPEPEPVEDDEIYDD